MVFKVGTVLLVLIAGAAAYGADVGPYTGPTTAGDYAATMTGKVLCGYQGWFTAEGDGSGKGWAHYQKHGKFEPGSCSIDLWPDVSELDADEIFKTPFKLADGKPAEVFSSHNRKTVERHFQWMKTYGIDGVFVQRFGSELSSKVSLNHCDVVLENCRAGANENGRVYAVMYDLAGLPAGGTATVVADWKRLVERMKIGRDGRDHSYLRQAGRPVVAVWGIGFSDKRKYTLKECAALVEFLQHDPVYGGNAVMIGVPNSWRSGGADAVKDPELTAVAEQADVISPWTIGRYATPVAALDHGVKILEPDAAWCAAHGKVYLPVVFPGFSWHNMNAGSPTNQIPRLKGAFLWSQYLAAKKAGATAVYQAMFDEMDEGTAIFKCTDQPPVGASQFVNLEGLPSDYYLWLTGTGGRMMRGEIAATDTVPKR